MSRRWIRLDAEWEESGWIHALPGSARGCWPRLLCWVKLRGKRGRCKWPDPVVLAGTWKVPRSAVENMLAGALADGAIHRDMDELAVANWAAYQEPDLTAAERKRRQRAKTLLPQQPPPGDGHGTVTDVTRDTVTRPPTTDRVTTKNSGGPLNVGNSEPLSRTPEHSVASVALEADQVLGLGTWGGELSRKHRETKDLINRQWLGRGVSLASVSQAIHGLRAMVDGGEVDWLKTKAGKPIDGLEVLLKEAVVDGADGSRRGFLFQLAQEAYARPAPQKKRGPGTGIQRIQVHIGGSST